MTVAFNLTPPPLPGLSGPTAWSQPFILLFMELTERRSQTCRSVPACRAVRGGTAPLSPPARGSEPARRPWPPGFTVGSLPPGLLAAGCPDVLASWRQAFPLLPAPCGEPSDPLTSGQPLSSSWHSTFCYISKLVSGSCVVLISFWSALSLLPDTFFFFFVYSNASIWLLLCLKAFAKWLTGCNV